MTDYFKLYQDYGSYNVNFNQLNLTSPSSEYAWYKTKKTLHDETKKLILKLRQDKGSISVCDIGCGNGGFLMRLAQEINDPMVKYVGVDISKPFIDFANHAVKAKKLKNISFKLYDVESQSLPDTFDIVVSSEVLEHLQNPDIFIKHVYSQLRPKGYFLLSTPNAKNAIKYPLFFLKNLVTKHNEKELRKSLTKDEETYKLAEVEQHIKTFSHSELHSLLGSNGFSIYKIPRSTTVFGGPFLDRHRVIWASIIIFDAIADLLPFPQIGWDCIVFTQKK